MYKHPLLDRDKMTPQEALDVLIDGNHRFSNNLTANKDLHNLVMMTKDKQHPFVSMLSCSDSRAPVEMVFDQALGDVFSVRLAGNIASDKAIGSLEFGCKYLGSKLIVVLGHTGCGAVKAACDNFKDGHIGEITNLIKPAVRLEKSILENRNSSNDDFVAKVCELSVQVQMDEIMHTSDILQDMVASKQIAIIGGIYDLATGEVRFMQNALGL
ncbi:carbonic anhydrase [Methylotenera sp.]|uniref:carbonic anhydrase n=1 Tax=Methylotenera sp. TaxID=2051956 RepID=UPI0027209AF4|nr:carbonic anhydrase [Methylotenera sp.]MDO9205118.1 carbonic anhydrase [Methylotenera sp.]MDP2071014.1 carbonic anhydrase [Methylotenera sp.]MDP2231212.1 carbonic anhydrase [Methylotenera sp.]MDP3005888.1 carbonic anhydrase [Methylotenera sp.]MDP3140062.1 carbonic anhydrase [Methylotenera sp.]